MCAPFALVHLFSHCLAELPPRSQIALSAFSVPFFFPPPLIRILLCIPIELFYGESMRPTMHEGKKRIPAIVRPINYVPGEKRERERDVDNITNRPSRNWGDFMQVTGDCIRRKIVSHVFWLLCCLSNLFEGPFLQQTKILCLPQTSYEPDQCAKKFHMKRKGNFGCLY